MKVFAVQKKYRFLYFTQDDVLFNGKCEFYDVQWHRIESFDDIPHHPIEKYTLEKSDQSSIQCSVSMQEPT